MSLILEVKPRGGSTRIWDSIAAALRIAKAFEVVVAFEFNGERVVVYSDSDPAAVEKDYFDRVNENFTH